MHSAIAEYRKWAISNGIQLSSNRPHVLTTNVEHCATELPLKHWEEQGLIGRYTRHLAFKITKHALDQRFSVVLNHITLLINIWWHPFMLKQF